MPLQNRVTPEGAFVASEARGLFMGNRGGRLHDPETRQLGNRRHASKRWICCALDFRGRRREIWGDGYTELFFLDEVTALAAGHRPCFECRRARAEAFRDAIAVGQTRLSVDQLDSELHRERLSPHRHMLHEAEAAMLPDGAMVLHEDAPHAVLRGRLLPWHVGGWGAPAGPPHGTLPLITPPLVVRALSNGYSPEWHPSALAGADPAGLGVGPAAEEGGGAPVDGGYAEGDQPHPGERLH